MSFDNEASNRDNDAVLDAQERDLPSWYYGYVVWRRTGPNEYRWWYTNYGGCEAAPVA
jgi:hypothetical protein